MMANLKVRCSAGVLMPFDSLAWEVELIWGD